MKEKFPNTRKPSHPQVCGKFWNLGKQRNWERKKKEPTDYVPSQTSSGEVAWTLESASSKQGLNREAWNACLGWGPGLHALRNNLRELT